MARTTVHTFLLSLSFFTGLSAQQPPQPLTQQVQAQPAANPNPPTQSACVGIADPDAKIACLDKERETLLKYQKIKKMEDDNAAIANGNAKPDLQQPAAKRDSPKKQVKRTDCLMPGDKQKMPSEFFHGFYDVNRAKIIANSKGQITPPTWAEIHIPLPPCPAEPAIPAAIR